MAYRFLDEYKQEFGLRWLLKKLHIHPNAYYNYLRNTKASYHAQKSHYCQRIQALYHESHGVMGHRQMREFLQREGISLSKTTVHKYMNRELQLYSICRRKRPAYHRGLAHKIFPNLLKRNFSPKQPNRVWCTDFTYMTLTNGTMRYNCSIIDLYDRSVVAGENSSFITSSLAVRTLEKALSSAKAISQNLILHSDQGSQFTSAEFVQHCWELGISQSMSRAGCPYDNAPMECYYNTLKTELIYQHNFETAAEPDYAVSEFAYDWYNQVRPHSYNGYLTPFEKRSECNIKQWCYKKG